MSEPVLSVTLQQPAPIRLDVSFTCKPGEVTAILGPSGSGKTTILRAVAGLLRVREAEIRVGMTSWCDTTAGTFIPPHQRAVGFVFQEYALFPHLTALGNVQTALGHHPPDDQRRRAEALLARLGLGGLGRRRPHELSGGERQRVALARALARDPQVLLLDEPFAALDRDLRRRLQAEVDELRRTLHIPVVLVTHDADDVERLAAKVVTIATAADAGDWRRA